jgi:hypothetical protein
MEAESSKPASVRRSFDQFFIPRIDGYQLTGIGRLVGTPLWEESMTCRAFSARRPKFGSARFLIAILAVAGFLFLAGARPCYAGNGNGGGTSITQVEEDWELDLNTPNSADGAPQLTCLMSTSGSTSGIYSVFQINQRTEPDGNIGGLQLQLWNGGSLLAVGNFANTSALATAGEKIQWTHRLSVANNGTLTDEIVGLSSSTWSKRWIALYFNTR